MHVYRPGLKAVKEMGVLSPLAMHGFAKEEVRRLAEELGVSVAKRPSTPCLATRLPYGAEIRPEILEKIAKAEEYLKKEGFPVVRLRLHGEIARVEIPKEHFGHFLKMQETLVPKLKAMGFRYLTLDMGGRIEERKIRILHEKTRACWCSCILLHKFCQFFKK